MAKAKATLPPEIAQAAAIAGVEEYEDRRAIPAAHVPYEIEDDPILAIGDPRVHASSPSPLSANVASDVDPASAQQRAEGSPTAEPRPRIVIADDADPISRLASTMERLMERQTGPSPMDPALAALLGGMMKTMEALVQQQIVGGREQAEALRRSQDPSNPHAPNCSVFNPRGERDYPRPKLKCKMFLPWEAEWESMTREEIELLNLIEPGEYYIKRNDESRIKMDIRADMNVNTGNPDRVLITHDTALNNDYHWLMPPMRMWLRQVLSQRPVTKAAAAKVMTMEEELDLIEQYGVGFEKVLAMKNAATGQEVSVG